MKIPTLGKRHIAPFANRAKNYRDASKLLRNRYMGRNMPTISAGFENGMIIMRCDSVRSGNSWPNRILQIAYKKLGEIHLLY